MKDSLGCKGVVSYCDPKTIKIIWKPIPELDGYYASNLGTIKRINNDGYEKNIKFYTNKTSVGTYLVCWIRINTGHKKHFSIHQLVCLAFHGFPPSRIIQYEVNHKDGNKHNNIPSNLEWVTRSENTIHALMSGLRSDNLTVLVKDIQTGENREVHAIKELAKQFNVPRHEMKKLISKHRHIPYQNKWLFIVDLNRLGKINREHIDKIKAYDFVEEKEIYADSCASMSYMTHVTGTTIALNSRTKTNKLLAGYVFKRQEDNTPYPDIDKESAMISRKEYFSKTEMVSYNGYLVKDYRTGIIHKFNRRQDVALFTGLRPIHIGESTNPNTSLKIFDGKVIKRDNDPRDWPNYNPIAVELSSQWKDYHILNPVEVTDIISNTTKHYPSAPVFARDVGIINADKVKTFVERDITKPLQGRYIVRRLPLYV